MMRRGLIGIFCMIALAVGTVELPAQEPARMTLSQRLQQLRRGLLSREPAEPAAESAPPRVAQSPQNPLPLTRAPEVDPTPAATKRGLYPRVDGRRLLPPDYEIRRQLKLEDVLGSRKLADAKEPRLASLPDQATDTKEKVVEDVLPLTEEGGAAKKEEISEKVEQEPEAISSSDTDEIAAPDTQQVVPQDRGFATANRAGSARKSPGQAGRFEFDPGELRRELTRDRGGQVATSGKDAQEEVLTEVDPTEVDPTEGDPPESDLTSVAESAETTVAPEAKDQLDPSTIGQTPPLPSEAPVLLNTQQPMPTLAEQDDSSKAPEDRYGTPRVASTLPDGTVANPFSQNMEANASEQAIGSLDVPAPSSHRIAGQAAPNFAAANPPLHDAQVTAEAAGDAEQIRLNGIHAFGPSPDHAADANSTMSVDGSGEPEYRRNRSADGVASQFAEDPNQMVPVTQDGGAFGFAGSANRSNFGLPRDVLATERMPMISSHVAGPKQIIVGREATYRLYLVNRGAASADDMVAQIRVPDWADIVDTKVTNGIVQRSQEVGESGMLRWQMHRLAGESSETLDLKLVPRASTPLKIGMTWSHAPVDALAVVEVQEPKLRMHITGPDEVLFGKPQMYRLSLTNPGTGPAEQVEINLYPPGEETPAVSSYLLGDLPAGMSKSVEMELTAREAGKLLVKATAAGKDDLQADASKEIFCRKPEIEVDWRGPQRKYTGTEGTYYFRVRNPGTAAADDVNVYVRLPEGLEFVSASDNQAYDSVRGGVTWRVGALRPGDDFYMELKCRALKAGEQRIDIEAVSSEPAVADRTEAVTNVVALADLKLEILDPTGPIPIQEEATYEIRIRNRGTNTAEEVNVAALFSRGLEPLAVEGGEYSIADGRVSFRTIGALGAGREVTFRIRAKAAVPGTHVFRAEVLCRDLEIKLGAEETTRFYRDDPLNTMKAQSASRSEIFEGMRQ